MTEAAHHRLGPSAAAKWLSCTAAPGLEATLPPEPESEYAAEGTYWHSWAEVELSGRLGHITERTRKMRLKKLQQSDDGKKFYSLDGKRHVEHYADLVMEEVADLGADFLAGFVEVRVRLHEWVPDSFGTADCILIGGGVVHVIDLKMGQGVPVSAVENPQAQLYGLGALWEFGVVYDIDTVRMTIIQPRLHSVSTFELSAEALLAWAEEVVRPAALAASSGVGAEFRPSDSACRWCIAKAVCRPRMEAATAEDFGTEPNTLDNAELAALLERLPAIKAWAADVEKYTLAAAKAGEKFPGWKLVEGRSSRKITDPETAAARLLGAGYGAEDIFKPAELQTLTALAKLPAPTYLDGDTAPKALDVLGDALTKPPGAPTLVPETDKRPELGTAASAAADFADGEELL